MSNNGKEPSNGDEFEEALTQLVRRAVLNGVDVEGGWDVATGATNGNPHPDFTVEIYYLSD